MGKILEFIKMGATLGAAILLGHWFLAELKNIRALNKPFYRVYLTLPGFLIIMSVLIPAVLWFFDFL